MLSLTPQGPTQMEIVPQFAPPVQALKARSGGLRAGSGEKCAQDGPEVPIQETALVPKARVGISRLANRSAPKQIVAHSAPVVVSWCLGDGLMSPCAADMWSIVIENRTTEVVVEKCGRIMAITTAIAMPNRSAVPQKWIDDRGGFIVLA